MTKSANLSLQRTHGLLTRIYAVVTLLSLHAMAADNPAQPQDRKVRVVCRYTKTYFDVSVSLKTFPDDISPKAFLDAVAEQTANRYTQEWIGWCRILRWDADSQKYIQLDCIQIRNGKAFLNRVQNGDFLLFNGAVCRF